jgi:hypothetical protein
MAEEGLEEEMMFGPAEDPRDGVLDRIDCGPRAGDPPAAVEDVF